MFPEKKTSKTIPTNPKEYLHGKTTPLPCFPPNHRQLQELRLSGMSSVQTSVGKNTEVCERLTSRKRCWMSRWSWYQADLVGNIHHIYIYFSHRNILKDSSYFGAFGVVAQYNFNESNSIWLISKPFGASAAAVWHQATTY